MLNTQHIRLISFVVMLILVFRACFVYALPEETDDYNYFATDLIVVSDSIGRHQLVGAPVSSDEFLTNTGSIIYSYIIKYASSFEESAFELEASKYTLHLSGGQKYRAIRVHESWLSYSDRIAFMDEQDAKNLHRLLESVVSENDLPEDEVGDYIERGIDLEDKPFFTEKASIQRAKEYYKKLRAWYEDEHQGKYPGANEISQNTLKANDSHQYKDSRDTLKSDVTPVTENKREKDSLTSEQPTINKLPKTQSIKAHLKIKSEDIKPKTSDSYSAIDSSRKIKKDSENKENLLKQYWWYIVVIFLMMMLAIYLINSWL